jgi:hypothetical protein
MIFMVLNIAFYGFEYDFFMGLEMFFLVLIWFGIDLGPGLGQW